MEGRLGNPVKPLDALGLARRHDSGGKRDDVLNLFTRLLTVRDTGDALAEQVNNVCAEAKASEELAARLVVSAVLALPEAQLG